MFIIGKTYNTAIRFLPLIVAHVKHQTQFCEYSKHSAHVESVYTFVSATLVKTVKSL